MPGLGLAALFAAVLVPPVLVRRSVGRREIRTGGILLLAIPPVGSLVWLWWLSSAPASESGTLRGPLVLFLGFYLTTLVVWSLAFLRSGDGS